MNAVKAAVNKVLATATAVLFAIMVLAVVWQVFTREVTQSPAAWTEELARYIFVWTALVGATLVFAERGHIAVTFVVERLPSPIRRGIAVLIQLVILVFALGILVVGGAGAAQNTWNQQLTALPGTIGLAYLILPITGVAIALIAIVHLVDDLRGQGPLTTAATQAEDDVPVVPGLEDAEEDSPLAEQTPAARDGDDGDDGDGTESAPDTDPKEK